MATNYFKWEGARRGRRWETPMLAILSAVVLASGAHAYTSYRRHQTAMAHCTRAEAAWCSGRIGEAEREFSTALRVDPGLFAARDQLAIVAWQRGDRERSLALLREGVRLQPDSFDALRSLGETLFLMQDYAGAIPILERAEAIQAPEPGRPSLLKTCRQALTDPPKIRRISGPWTGQRSHATIHSSGHSHHDCGGDHAVSTSKPASHAHDH